MDDNGPSSFTTGTQRDLFAGLAGMALICIIPFALADGEILTALAAGGGAFLIWLIVKRINLHHELGEGKRPPDPP